MSHYDELVSRLRSLGIDAKAELRTVEVLVDTRIWLLCEFLTSRLELNLSAMLGTLIAEGVRSVLMSGVIDDASLSDLRDFTLEVKLSK